LKKAAVFLITAIIICSTCAAQEDSVEYYFRIGKLEDSLGNYTAAMADFSHCIQINPELAEPWVARACMKNNLKDCYGALADCNKALELEPDNANAYSERGAIYIVLENYKDAISEFNKAIQFKTQFAAAYYNRALCWYYLDDADRSSKDLDSARSIDPNFRQIPVLSKALGNYYSRTGWEKYGKNGMYTEAIAEFKKGLVLNDTSENLWYNTGGAYYYNKQYAEAKEAFQMALKLQPDNDNAKKGLDAAEQMIEDEKDLKKHTILNDSSDYYYERAQLEDSLKNYTAALADYSQCLHNDSEMTDAWIARANVKYLLKDYNGSIADYNKALELEPGNELVYASRAIDYVAIENYERAITDCNAAIEKRPRFAQAFVTRAYAWYLLNDIKKSEADFDSTRAIDPKCAGLVLAGHLLAIYYEKNGWEKYGKNGMFIQSIAEYKKGLALESTNVNLWYNIGGAYYSIKQYPKAKEAFQKVLELAPDNSQAKHSIEVIDKITENGK